MVERDGLKRVTFVHYVEVSLGVQLHKSDNIKELLNCF